MKVETGVNGVATWSGFLGLRNVALPRNTSLGALRKAQNVDVDDEGALLSRPGYIKVFSGSNITAAYSMLHHDYGYIVDSGVLYRVTATLGTARIGEVGTGSIVFEEAGKFVFMSSGHIVNETTLVSWRLPPPPLPQITVSTGELQSGWYQVVATREAPDGRESASCFTQQIYVPTGGGISVQAEADTDLIYVTAADGEVFYLAGYGSCVITSTEEFAVPLSDELLLKNALPNDIELIAFYNASVHVSTYDSTHDTSIVWSSIPFRWHVFDVERDYIQLPGRVLEMASTPKGLIIGTDRAIHRYDGETLDTLADFGVVPGWSAAQSPSHPHYIWTQRGLCKVDPFENLTYEKVQLPPGSHCYTAIVEQHGIEKFIVLTDGAGQANNTAP